MKKRKQAITFFFIMVLIGLMLSVQYNMINKQKTSNDTENVWQLRESISEAQDIQMKLVDEIANYEKILDEYNQSDEYEYQNTLDKTLEELQLEAGIKETSGKGFVIQIEQFVTIGEEVNSNVSADLLSLLINELNKYEVNQIAINDERVTIHTSIRDVNGRTYVNNKALSPLPVTISIISDKAEIIIKELNYSLIMDQFAIEDLLLQMEEKEGITLPKGEITITELHIEDIEEGDK